MFIGTGLFTFTAPQERNVYRAFRFAPMELGFVCECCGYKYSAPTELNALGSGLSRAV